MHHIGAIIDTLNNGTHNSMRIVTSLLLVFLLPFNARGQVTCDLEDGQYEFCQCKMSDGSGIVDLSPYANSNGDPAFTAKESGSPEYDYNINLCFPLTEDGNCDKSAGCQHRPSDSKKWSLGGYKTTKFIVDSQNGLYLQYTDGTDKRKMKIILVCDKNVPITDYDFTFDGEKESFEYEFTLTSPCACPSPSGKCAGSGGGGGGGGSEDSDNSSDPGVVGIVLMCLAFAAFVGYFIAGAVFLRVRHQKSGTDLIIHKNFWKDFPFLVKDGVVFTFTPVCNVIRGQGYKSMPT